MNPQYSLWRHMQLCMGDAKLWPKDIRRLFWTKDLELWQLVMLCVFTYVNEMDTQTFLEWIDMNDLCIDGQTRFSIGEMADVGTQGGWNDDIATLFSYNVQERCLMTLDGRKVYLYSYLWDLIQ